MKNQTASIALRIFSRLLVTAAIGYLGAALGLYAYGAYFGNRLVPSKEVLDFERVVGTILYGIMSPTGIMVLLFVLLAGISFAFLRRRWPMLMPFAIGVAFLAFTGLDSGRV